MKTSTQILTMSTDYDRDGKIRVHRSQTNTYDSTGNLLTHVHEADNDGDGNIDSRSSALYEYFDGSEYVMGVSHQEIELFSDNSIDFQVEPLSEKLNLPFSISSDVM